jgi:hypothetical protein
VFFELYPKKVKKASDSQDSTNTDHEDKQGHENSDNNNMDHEVVPAADDQNADDENHEETDDSDSNTDNDDDNDERLRNDVEEANANTASEEQNDHVNLKLNGDILDVGNMSGELEERLDNHHNDCEARPEVQSRPVLKLAMPEPEAAPEAAKEFMSDGEVMRECRPGFQDLKNCKRFWQAQQLIGTRKEGGGRRPVH